jgi:PIN domain nuclease of toxin-antitoxin system
LPPQSRRLPTEISTASTALRRAEKVQHGQAAGSLPGPHRDPFDLKLIAQATLADLVLLSNEAVFDRYGIRRLW